MFSPTIICFHQAELNLSYVLTMNSVGNNGINPYTSSYGYVVWRLYMQFGRPIM